LHQVLLDWHQGLFCDKLWNNNNIFFMPFGKKMEVTSFGGTLLAQYAKEVACQVPHQTLCQLPSHEISCDFHYLMHHINCLVILCIYSMLIHVPHC
jgi:hypothetical protein